MTLIEVILLSSAVSILETTVVYAILKLYYKK
jgi:hypothetical protein